MNDIYQYEEELKARINFREVDGPCCAKCKWFEREYESTKCHHPQTQDVSQFGTIEPEAICTPALWPEEHNVCDLFETGEYKHLEENEYWTRKAREEQSNGKEDNN